MILLWHMWTVQLLLVSLRRLETLSSYGARSWGSSRRRGAEGVCFSDVCCAVNWG
jgi:hypothetical protein